MATLTRTDIYHAVTERARRHGSRNIQDFAHLKHQLSTAESDEVFWGLLQPFVMRSGEDAYDIQALAGRLLFCLNPSCPIGLEQLIQQVASAYNFSVEELPWYLAQQFGYDQLLATLESIPSGSESGIPTRVIVTFKYWLSDDWRQRAGEYCR
jgi:hypothetical protein